MINFEDNIYWIEMNNPNNITHLRKSICATDFMP